MAIVAVVTLTTWLFLYSRKNDRDRLFVANFYAGLVLIMAFMFVTMYSTTHFNEVSQNTPSVTAEYELVTLNDGSQVNGRFFLASGAIGERMYYQYYYKTEDGAIQYGKVGANSRLAGPVKIFEEDRSDAVLQKLRFEREFEWNRWLHIPWFVWDYDGYTFRVPEGTVLHDVTLDLK